MSKTTEFLGWANALNYDPSKKDAAGPVVGFPTVGFGDISNAYKTSLIPKTAPGSVGGTFSPSAFLNSVQSGRAMQSGVGAAQEQAPAGGVGDTKDTSTGAGFVPNQILVDSLKTKLFGQKSAGEIDTGKLEFDAWKGQFGIDTDKNFQDSASRLDYEMKTWAANYGANAERMARMGLSNSGVVDVYGTGVVQAYLSAMNDLYLAKAEGDRQNAEAYKQYSDQYDADLAARTEAKNNKILQGYNYGLGLYTGNNMDAVTTMIRNAGYDEGEISEIVARLGAVDPSMLPALQAQAKQDQEDINTAIDQLIKSGYKTEMEESVEDIYRAKDWSEEKIAKLIQGVNGLVGLNKASGADPVVEAYNSILASESGYDPSMATQIHQLYTANGMSEEDADRLITMLDEYAATRKSAQESTAADQQTTNIQNAPIETVTADALVGELQNAQVQYGVDSAEYKKVATALGQKAYDLIRWALEGNPDGTAKRITNPEVAAALGLTLDEKEAGDPSAIESAILEKAGELRGRGVLNEEQYGSVVQDWVTTEIDGYIKKDAEKLRATGLQDAGGVVEDLLDWKNRGYLTEEQYNAQLKTVIDKMKLDATVSGTLTITGSVVGDAGGNIYWDDTKNGGKAEYYWLPGMKASESASKETKAEIDKLTEGRKDKMVVYNGDVYIKDLLGWVKMTPDNLIVKGDGVANTKEQRAGIYEILVTLLSK